MSDEATTGNITPVESTPAESGGNAQIEEALILEQTSAVEQPVQPISTESSGITQPEFAAGLPSETIDLKPEENLETELSSSGSSVPAQTTESAPITENSVPENINQKPIEETISNTQQVPTSNPAPASMPFLGWPREFLMQMLAKANATKEARRRKKIEKIMTLFIKKQKITNDMVEKLLHVSDETATRYLNILVKEGRILRNGKAGGTFYIKV